MKEIDHLGLPLNPKDIVPGLGIMIARLRKVNPDWTEDQLRFQAKILFKKKKSGNETIRKEQSS